MARYEAWVRWWKLKARSRSLKVAAVWLLVMAVAQVFAHDIITTNLTYTRDISRILNARCASCHGVSDSIPLTSYAEVRPWAVSMKEQVLSRKMPPWGAVKGFGDFSPDFGLTQEEMTILAAWVVGGAPEGDPAALPQPSAQMSRRLGNVPLQDAVRARTTVTLDAPLEALAIKPLEDGTVASTKLIGRLPDGQVLPLLWLYQFDGRSAHSFRFRTPLLLPAGTVVEASSPLSFAIETRRLSKSSSHLGPATVTKQGR